MPIAVNPDSGQAVFLGDDGAWKPAQTAVNPQTKEMLAFDGKQWSSVPAQSKGVLGYIDDAVRSLASGVTFGYADELAAKANSLVGNGSYEKNLAAEHSRDAQIPAAIAIPGQIAGAVGGAVAAAPVTGAVSAATGLSRLPGIVRAIGSGAGAGALYGSGNAEPGQRLEGAAQGAAVGGVAGGLAVPLAAGAQKLAQPIADLVRGVRDPQGEAARRVVTGIQRDASAGNQGLSPTEFMDASQAGQPVSVMDIGGETTRALARDAANKNPEARAVLNRTIDDRFESQGPRLTDWLNKTFNYPNATAQQAAIDQVEKSVNGPAYRKAYAEGDKPIWSPQLEQLAGSPAVADAMKSAITTGKDRAITQGFGAMRVPFTVTQDGQLLFNKGPNGVPTYPNLQFWDQARRELSNGADAAARAGRNEDATRLGSLARSMNDALDNVVPSYKNARSGAAQFFGAENALEAGQNYVTQNFANPATRATLAKMSPQEKQLFQDGFVSRLIDTVNQTGDRRNIVGQIGQSPAAREKLAIALGPQKANQLEAYMNVEAVMDQARGAVQGNSSTVRQLLEGGLTGAGGYAVATGDYKNPGNLLTAALVGGAVRGAGGRIAQRVDQNVARHVADLLTSNDVSRLNRGIEIVSRNPVFMQALRDANASSITPMTAAATSQLGRLPAPQIPAIAGANEQNVPRPPGQ